MLSIADLGWGSVVGNSLDNGITYMPNGADFMAPCGMEVVLANGDVLRTGMGAMPGNRSWHVYKRGLGPTLDSFFMQSNYGIVTRMGIWLMPKPKCFMPVWVRAWNEDDLGPIMDTLRELRLDRTLEGVPSIYNTLVIASVFTTAEPVDAERGSAAGRDDRQDRPRARVRPLERPARALRRRGRRRLQLREGQGGVRADSRRRRPRREVRGRRHPEPPEPWRSGHGRRARASSGTT